MRQTIVGWILRGIAVVVVGVTGLAAPVLAVADTVNTQVEVNTRTMETTIFVTGTVQTTDGQGVVGAAVTIYMDSLSQGTAITLDGGSYTYTILQAASGSHNVQVVYPGDSRYGASTGNSHVAIGGTLTDPTRSSSSQRGTTLTVALDPTQAYSGDSVSITGSLTSNGSPVASSLVSLSVDYGQVASPVGTGSDGTYQTIMALPDGDTFPSTFTVTVSFSGDDVYNSSSAQASGSIAAQPTPVATTEPSPDPTSSSTSTATSQATPLPTATQSGSNSGNTALRVVGVVFFSVALIAVGTLVALGLISHSHKRLARDERRGFGTDFGKAR
ncbi:MAG: Ig-like domain-containing protein [Propionibacteriaceae bacterium]|nr:Ig-like domain-containing protein [Propionibacteriaceae bacterium]